jgi:hypothetical protein
VGCPSPYRPGGQSLRLKVTKWCGLAAPHGQWQLKLQLSITNTGTRPLGIALTHIRLAMAHFEPARWRPPSTEPGQRPFVSTYQGRRVWLVPASPDGAAEPNPPPRGNFTFATHWNAPTPLAPHSTFRPGFHRGDAVFFVPRAAHRGSELDDIVGIAYVNGPDVLDICPPERWGPKVAAGSF